MARHGTRSLSALLTPQQNGVGAFVLQCRKMDFHYCDWAGSSKGMKYVARPHSCADLRGDATQKQS